MCLHDFVWWLLAQRFVCFLLPEGQEKNWMTHFRLRFWKLSLGNLYTLEKTMHARDTSNPAGSKARVGE